jgi:alkaline phosphatase D
MNPLSRRTFLRKTGAGLLAPYLLFTDEAGARRHGDDPFAYSRLRPPSWVFRESVASGDPTSTGVVLWTRLHPPLWRRDLPLAFLVAEDPDFTRIVHRGLVDPAGYGPDTDFTVHVDLDGLLEPNRFYYYRFIYRRTASRPGRCRTLPPPGYPLEKIGLGVITCQDYPNGYYGAFARLALDPEIDYVVHLGDLIYESTGDTDFQNSAFPDRRITLPSRQSVAFGLDDFRSLYRTYRSDRAMQLAMEVHTWIVIWDDHETANDCYWDYDRDTLGAPDHPFQTQRRYGNDPARLRRLKLDAQQAWAEYVPTRIAFNPLASHPHDAMSIYRHLDIGDLVRLVLTDERTYRMAHPCGEQPYGRNGRLASPGCPAQFAPGRTMLGDTQRAWFLDTLTSSPAIWNTWANEVFLGALTLGDPAQPGLTLNLDAWDGFAAERTDLLRTLRDAAVSNLVVLTGDLHTYLAALVKIDYGQTANDDPANVIGVEFMTPAITSARRAFIMLDMG